MNDCQIVKNTSEKSDYFLIILFSFWILIFPTYLSSSTLDDLYIASFYTCTENIDQQDSIPGSEEKETISILTFKATSNNLNFEN
jgi:hypothetical protein